MRIAIPTNDRETLFLRTGRAKEFAVYSIDDKKANFVEYRSNPHQHDSEDDRRKHNHHGHHSHHLEHGYHHEHDNDHHHGHNHRDMAAAFKDCYALLLNHAGTHLREDFKSAGIFLFKTSKNNLDEIVKTFAEDMDSHAEI
jgi:predicted Fe-Mo cluster-binding NifX family protein